jgi:hypothetical protein
MKHAVLFLAILLTGCNSPRESGVKVIVGAKLITAPGREPIEYSVIVIDGAKFRAVGPQSTTPVPKGAEMTRGLGMTIQPVPGGGPIEPGQPADLVLKGSTDRVMRRGEWVQ